MTNEMPNAFIWRRLHSLMGFWLVLFLIEHLLANSQAALFVGEDGSGFVRAVNFIQDLPYLPVIEIILLGVPFLIHGLYGLYVLKTGKINSFYKGGQSPYLTYGRNKAYTWQRITSWILLFGHCGSCRAYALIDILRRHIKAHIRIISYG